MPFEHRESVEVCATERQKVALQRELDSLAEQIKTLEEALNVKPEYGMGKSDPTVTQWEFNQAMLERLQGRVDELQEAPHRLDHGTYGICVRCGKRINPERLASLPDTRRCVQCAQKR